MIDSCQHIMDTCLTVILLHDYCTQTYINLHKLFTRHCNFICVLSVVIIKKVQEAMKKLKNQKSPGCDGIPAELWKATGESGIRLMHVLSKDNVLAKPKAYNVDALVDFVCTTMKVYYRRWLLDFAHNRVAKPALWLSRLMSNTAFLSADSIQQTSDTTFEVPSASDPAMSYCVDVSLGMCSCASSLVLAPISLGATSSHSINSWPWCVIKDMQTTHTV